MNILNSFLIVQGGEKMNVNQKEEGKKTRIFLSYAISDAIYAHKLLRLLFQRSNLRVFTTEMLSAGENWESKLKEEISQCDIFMMLLSPNSVDSNWVLHELGAAWALNKSIIPVVIHPETVPKIPVQLRKSQLVVFDDFKNPETINKILNSYEGRRSYVT